MKFEPGQLYLCVTKGYTGFSSGSFYSGPATKIYSTTSSTITFSGSFTANLSANSAKITPTLPGGTTPEVDLTFYPEYFETGEIFLALGPPFRTSWGTLAQMMVSLKTNLSREVSIAEPLLGSRTEIWFHMTSPMGKGWTFET